MTTINLKEFFYWYKTDEYIEVTDEVAEELRADKRYEVTHHRRMKRNKANYSLDADDGIEYAACEFEPSPEMALDLMEQYRRLCCALNQLPLFQGQRIDAYYLQGWTIREIAKSYGVSGRAVIQRVMSELHELLDFTSPQEAQAYYEQSPY